MIPPLLLALLDGMNLHVTSAVICSHTGMEPSLDVWMVASKLMIMDNNWYGDGGGDIINVSLTASASYSTENGIALQNAIWLFVECRARVFSSVRET